MCAGVRGLEIQGNFVKFTAIGVYLEDTAVPSLSIKWSGKSADELSESVEFFRDIVTGNRSLAAFISAGSSLLCPGLLYGHYSKYAPVCH